MQGCLPEWLRGIIAMTDLDTLGGAGHRQGVSEHQRGPGQLLSQLIPRVALNGGGLGVWTGALNVTHLGGTPVVNLLLEIQVITGGRLVIAGNIVNLQSFS